MKSLVFVACPLLVLAGCASEPLPAVGPQSAIYSPANPDARAPRAANVSVTAGYRHYTPVEVGDWRELNRRVAPPQTPQGGSGHAH